METKEKLKSFQELINSDKPVLVDFYADWCGPCKMMPPVLNELKRKLGDKITIVKIDVDKNKRAAATYQIRGVPTLMLFQKGKVRWKQSGVVPARQIEAAISQNIV